MPVTASFAATWTRCYLCKLRQVNQDRSGTLNYGTFRVVVIASKELTAYNKLAQQ
jgi:hypothetical protein